MRIGYLFRLRSAARIPKKRPTAVNDQITTSIAISLIEFMPTILAKPQEFALTRVNSRLDLSANPYKGFGRHTLAAAFTLAPQFVQTNCGFS